MKVLLTRPQGRNQAMEEQLTRSGVAYLVTPLLEVVATNEYLDQSHLNNADNLLFISTNAVEFAAQQLQNRFPHHCRYFAVGQATADSLAALNINAITAPETNQDSEGLLSLPQLQNVQKQTFIIVRGVGGRETLAEQLIARGAAVSYWQVYQRVTPTLNRSTICEQWQSFGIDTIVVTSGEILSNLVGLVSKESFAWLRSCHIIVPSNRVEIQAKAMGLSHITNANGANTQATLTSLGINLL
ncbi:uroporphyrinogen-III synthase [Shewanella inventionis]|uniref:Uroporphyrinogen-III synthase n=1 Tax=Shewanella inventionis TaxID=1738770 RepID=A0ABQ1JK20_9GAMM|nr:uroporphyrinogen-III synthase [Shewanella inventionis]MCL1159055.1 uroporphyrinogen-III synthase [Shewanella inventionis]UAL43251.1 uroporphyrinogen-III synthase [Shewanella inventionis]GGB71005.1 uroporphyrinogen III methyltransferase [Shewanella inventionis]